MWFHSEKSQNTLSRQAAAAWVTVLKACSFPASSHGVKGKRTLYTKGHGLGGSPSALTDQIIHKTLFCSVILTSHNPSSVIIYLGIKQRMRDSSCKVIWQHCSAFLIGRHQRLSLAGRLLLPSSLDFPTALRQLCLQMNVQEQGMSWVSKIFLGMTQRRVCEQTSGGPGF